MKNEKRMLWPRSDLMLNLTLWMFRLAALSVLFGLMGALGHIHELLYLGDAGWKVGMGAFLILFAIGMVAGNRAQAKRARRGQAPQQPNSQGAPNWLRSPILLIYVRYTDQVNLWVDDPRRDDVLETAFQINEQGLITQVQPGPRRAIEVLEFMKMIREYAIAQDQIYSAQWDDEPHQADHASASGS